MKPHMPIMEQLLNQISSKLTRVQNEPMWIIKLDLQYAYGQLKLREETSRQGNYAVTGGSMNGYYRLKKGFYGLSDIPTIFQRKMDRSLSYQTVVWVDDIRVVPTGIKRNTKKNYKTCETARSRIQGERKNPNSFLENNLVGV